MEKEEIHIAFLERLGEAPRNHTNLDPDAPNLFWERQIYYSVGSRYSEETPQTGLWPHIDLESLIEGK